MIQKIKDLLNWLKSLIDKLLGVLKLKKAKKINKK